MIFKLKTGCVCDSMTVDGVEEVDLHDHRRLEVINKICDFLVNEINTKVDTRLSELIKSVLYDYDLDDDSDLEVENIEELRTKPELLNYLLQELIPFYGSITNKYGPCECCGDTIYEWTWELA